MSVRSITVAWRQRLVARTLAPALDRACRHLAAKVEDAAPKESGELRSTVRSNRVKVTPAKISCAVIVYSDHALAVEYGTSKMTASPFFRPTILKEIPAMKAIVEEAAGL